MAANKTYNLDDVIPEFAGTITVGGEEYGVLSVGDLSFGKMNELTETSKAFEKSPDGTISPDVWDKVKTQILHLIPGLSPEQYDEHFSINRVTAFMTWHAQLSQAADVEKNESGAGS